MIKRALTSASALALMLVAAPVFAADVDVSGDNSTTGAGSANTNTHTVTDDSDVTVSNNAAGANGVVNTATGTVNTGANDQLQNTEGGSLDSGAVDASTDWESVVNSGAALTGAGDLAVDGDFANDTTGADSDNDNVLALTNDSDLTLTNTADVLNSLGLTADTGTNEQNENTTAGDVDTGGVGLDAAIANMVNNDSQVASAAYGEVDVDVSGENGTTGADSFNTNTYTIDNTGDTTVDNTGDVDNTITVDADTGNNDQLRNTTAGDLETGEVDVETDIENVVNNESGVASAAAGDLDVAGDFTNDTTGAGSDNDNVLTVTNDTDLTVTNDADVDNTLTVDADTGTNEQNENTTGGDVSTGDVSIDFNVTNEVNSN